jgi:hypothetical protein
MPELSGRELLREWRRVMDTVMSTASSVAGQADLPKRLVEPMQRQLELLEEIVEREQRMQKELTRRVVAPLDAVFDLLEESGGALRRQAETLAAAGRALEETAKVVETQAELFERAVGALRQPAEFAKASAGIERKPRKAAARSRRRAR